MHTVELLLDDRLEQRVREVWERLREAGLPSLADHRHPTNRPHLTMLTAASLAGLPPLTLPVRAELTAVRMLGRALVWAVTPTDELSRMQAELWSEGAWPPPPEWVPHVSLALNVPAARRTTALHLLAGLPAGHGHFVAARSYDTETRTVTGLEG